MVRFAFADTSHHQIALDDGILNSERMMAASSQDVFDDSLRAYDMLADLGQLRHERVKTQQLTSSPLQAT